MKKWEIMITATFVGVHEPAIDIYKMFISADTVSDALDKAKMKYLKKLMKHDVRDVTFSHHSIKGSTHIRIEFTNIYTHNTDWANFVSLIHNDSKLLKQVYEERL